MCFNLIIDSHVRTRGSLPDPPSSLSDDDRYHHYHHHYQLQQPPPNVPKFPPYPIAAVMRLDIKTLPGASLWDLPRLFMVDPLTCLSKYPQYALSSPLANFSNADPLLTVVSMVKRSQVLFRSRTIFVRLDLLISAAVRFGLRTHDFWKTKIRFDVEFHDIYIYDI